MLKTMLFINWVKKYKAKIEYKERVWLFCGAVIDFC